MNNKLERFKNGEEVSLHTPTEEISNALMKWCDDNDIKWCTGVKATKQNIWQTYKEETCYHNAFNMGLSYCYVEYCKQRREDILELTLEDFAEEKKMFTKKDLKTGMVVELKNGEKYMVLTGNLRTMNYGEQSLMFLSSDGFNVAGNWDNELNFINGSSNERRGYDEYDVIAVYSPCMSGVDNTIASVNESNLIWHRADEVDWSKIAVDTKVLVKDSNEREWRKRYFAGVNKDGELTAFCNGKTSFTCCGAGDVNVWKEMVLYEGNENLVEESK